MIFFFYDSKKKKTKLQIIINLDLKNVFFFFTFIVHIKKTKQVPFVFSLSIIVQYIYITHIETNYTNIKTNNYTCKRLKLNKLKIIWKLSEECIH